MNESSDAVVLTTLQKGNNVKQNFCLTCNICVVLTLKERFSTKNLTKDIAIV